MFTINQIREAHAKVKSGADFPGYVQEIKNLGVLSYDTFVSDGHTTYKDRNGTSTESEAKYANLQIAPLSDIKTLKHCLKIHQQGQTDYMTFGKQAAESGVEKWTVDTASMTCVYFDLAGNKMLLETIS
ncbi:DUF1398 domain-containing protein [Dyadobacter psychrotolerans]|uniref:DUF1398 domain-containing protein n=1 Tax=Dyadobacter psychrotolerans TaxID=2541721 RepID=A0A4R5DMS2_9BACT|nr:DUF1398 family protein [Dyadobacter psychrotolerans]TDE13350.1 DUF1398 domain-containing protein [Dyadobacter psychrotolerans]